MSVRLAVRALILREDRLLLVNAWPSGQSDLLCAPGGGVERGSSLPDNLQREVWEECGLRVEVGAVAMVNEFHDPNGSFHQVEVFFRCSIVDGDPDGDWTDPEGIVSERKWLTRQELATLHFKPGKLIDVAWSNKVVVYDPLEPFVR